MNFNFVVNQSMFEDEFYSDNSKIQQSEEVQSNNEAKKHTAEKEIANKISLKTYFNYDKINKIKYGLCLICGKDGKDKFKTSIKMIDSNTSGLKSHLMRKHKEEYKKLFGKTDSESVKATPVSKTQKTLDSAIEVSFQ